MCDHATGEVHVSSQQGRTVPQVRIPGNEVLAEVLHTGWSRGPLALVRGASERRGFMVESEVGVTFFSEYADEFETDDQDQVRLDYLDESRLIAADTYVGWVVRLALAATTEEFIAGVRDGRQVRALALTLA